MLFNLNNKIQSQKGAALLAFVLVMIVGSSFLLVSKLNAKVRNREDIEKTYASLNKAKEALISFALTIPERSNANPPRGPGFLPCPDTDNDGVAENACGVNSIGRIPHETLEIDTLVDGSGEVLWYTLSDNYRNNPVVGILNSESFGALILDNTPDVVALVFAPGISLAQVGQNRTADPNAVANYLENDNQDLDNNFISNVIGANPATFNDRVIAITRQELMSVVEKRVLGEARNAVNQIWSLPDNIGNSIQAYPWLRDFNTIPPITPPGVMTDFRGNLNIRQGLLPLLMNTAFYGGALNIAANNFNATWTSLVGGAFVGPNPEDPDVNCLRNSDCTELFYCDRSIDPACGTGVPVANYTYTDPMLIGGAFGAVTSNSCIWDDTVGTNAGRNSFVCTSQLTSNSNSICINGTTTCYATFTRTYSIVYTDDGSNVHYIAPTNVSHLQRNLFINGSFTNQIVITVSDQGDGNPLGQSTLTLTAVDPGGIMNIVGIDHHIDAVGVNLNPGNGPGLDNDYSDAGEIPPQIPTWFTINNWHHMVHIYYPPNETLPGTVASDCNAGSPPCLTLLNNGINNGVDINIRALAMIAGDIIPTPPLNQTANRTNVSNNLVDYFDLVENQNGDNVFDNQLSSNVFNDQFLIINP